MEAILEHMIENKKNINDAHKQSPSKSYFEFMSAEDKIKFKELLSKPVTTDFSVQKMENSIDELKHIYGKENVQNLLKNNRK